MKTKKLRWLAAMLLLVAAMVMPARGNAQVTLTYLSGSRGFDNETADNLFDRDTLTKWCYNAPSASSPTYVVFQASEPCRLNGYTITTANDNAKETKRNPKNWNIYGSNDQSTWTKLVSVSNDTTLKDVNFTAYNYTLNVGIATKYEYYKWEITANKGANDFQVSEFSISVSNCTDASHEVALSLVQQKEATCTAVGCQAFYRCSSCGRCYSDAAGKTEIDPATLTIPITGHTFDGVNGDCSVCGISHMYSYAGTAADPFRISTADDLYWFSAWVNGTYTPEEGKSAEAHLDAYAVLTNDITVNTGVLDANGTLASDVSSFRSWTPIGNISNMYTGLFDGQNHTVSGLYFNDTQTNYVGLFGCVGKGGKISNVGVVDSYLKGKSSVGGVCGYNYYGAINNCYNTGAVSGNTSVSGVCGLCSNGTISNCYNTGAVSGMSAVSGVCGWCNSSAISNCYNTGAVSGNSSTGGVCGNNDGIVSDCYNTGAVSGDGSTGGVCGNCSYGTLSNCYNTGAVSGNSDIGGVCGYYYSPDISKFIITNCYFDSTVYKGNAFGFNDGGPIPSVLGKTSEQFKSGEVAYLLSQGCTVGEVTYDGSIWGQTLSGTGKQDYPVLGGEKVYLITVYAGCKDNPGEPTYTYANTYAGPVYAEHSFDEHGFCTKCGGYQPATLTTDKYDINGDGTNDEVYEIGNAGQLYWFSAWVNGTYTPEEGKSAEKHLDACAVLTNDITVNTGVLDANGTLASDVSSFRSWTPIGNMYIGLFDGQNHTVSGLYFNDAQTNYVGLFGCVGENGKISNVGVVDSYLKGNSSVGGVCGFCSYGTISNCYNTGVVSGMDAVSGVCGFCNSSAISNCYNAGAVSGSIDNVGGVCGYNYYGAISNCYNAGAVSGSIDNVGGVCGYNNHGTITNCYFDSTVHNGNAVGYQENGAISSNVLGKTSEQFKSGEVAYLLSRGCTVGEVTYDGSVWGQTLSGTGKQDYPVLGGWPVYYRDAVYTNTYGILTVGTQTITASINPITWYEFTPTETGSYQFSSTQLTAGNLYVDTTKTESNHTDITTSPTYDLDAATTYYVAVSATPGSYDLTITRLNTSTAMEAVTASQIYAANGRIVCDGEFRIYDLLGRDVTRLNGSLQGVYVVITSDAAQTVIVK